jgi:hypothetical protein
MYGMSYVSRRLYIESFCLDTFSLLRYLYLFKCFFLYRSSWPRTRRRRWGHFARPFRTSLVRPPSSVCLPGQFKYYIRGEGWATARGLSEHLRTGHRHRSACQGSSNIILGEKVVPLREAFQNVFGQATVISLPARSVQILY